MNTNKQVIIAVAAHMGAGKETLLRQIRRIFGPGRIRHLRTNSAIKKVLKDLNLPVNRVNQQEIVPVLEKWKPGIIANAVRGRIEHCDLPIIYYDCMRLASDQDLLLELEELGYLVLRVAIHARQKDRWQRCVKRALHSRKHGKPDEATMTFRQFRERERQPTERDIDRLMKLARLSLQNDGTLRQFTRGISRKIFENAGGMFRAAGLTSAL